MSSVGIYIEPHTNYVGIGTTLPSQNFHVQGTGYFKDGISAGNMTLFRNKIINGDMKINQRGSSVYVASGPSNMYTVDRFQAISTGHTLNTRPITLPASDQASVDGLFTTAVALSPTPIDGLSVYYTFDGGSLLDSSGNGNHATTSAGSALSVTGRFGTNALYLSNEGNVIASSTQANNIVTSSYNCPSAFTASFWFMSTKLPLTGQSSVLFTTNSQTSILTNAVVAYIANVSGTISIWGAFNNTANTGAGSTISVNTWYHCAVTYNNGSLRIHLNGNPVANALSGTMATNGFSIGYGRDSGLLYPYAGYIDDFRIYTRVLTQPEIYSLYACTPTGISPDLSIITVPQGLYSRLTFDNTTSDSQGTLANPTPTGTTSYAINSRQGTYSLDLTANTAGSTTITTALTYTYTNSTLPISIAFWMNVTSIGVSYQIPVTMLNGANAVLQFYSDASGFGFGIWSGTSTQYIAYSTGIVKANTWHHVCGVASYNSLIQLYIDGIQVSTNNTPAGVFPTTTFGGGVTSLKIGSRDTSGSYAYRGYIDDVRIYTVALTSSQIAGLYYSQLQGYALYQQQIEGYTTADLGWGTTNAQPASLSCYLKNNTPTDQQFTFSIANSGAAAISAITFETNSGINDTLGFLTNPTGTSITYSTGVYKVGTRSLDVTANTISSAPVSYIRYNLPNTLQTPLSVSIWVYPTLLTTGYKMIFALGTSTAQSYQILADNSVNNIIYVDLYVSSLNNNSVSSGVSLQLNTWMHICSTIDNLNHKLYINGTLTGTTALSVQGGGILTVSGSATTPVNMVAICTKTNANVDPFKGYIDDVRIYNRALNASEVLQIYNLNSLSTTISPYLLPRSLICKTPIIPSNTWQKVAISFTGDNNTSSWNMDTSAGVVVTLCLASGSFYNAPSALTWNSITDYTVDNVQQYGYSSSHFMSNPGNSIYITGIQFEKGRIPTFYEVRPITMELQLCLRYFEFISRAVWGYGASVMNYATYPFKVSKRAIPSAVGGATYDSYFQITTDYFIVQRNNSTPDIQSVSFIAEL